MAGGRRCAGLAWVQPRFTPPRTCHNLPILSSRARRGGEAGGWGPDARVRGSGGGVCQSSQPPRWDLGPGWQCGGSRHGWAPTPPRCRDAMGMGWGCCRLPGCSWVQLGHPGARSCPLALANGGWHGGDAVPQAWSIPRHARVGLAPHFGVLPAPAPSSHGCGPCSSPLWAGSAAGCRGLWTHPASPAQGQRKGLFLFAGTVGSGTHPPTVAELRRNLAEPQHSR